MYIKSERKDVGSSGYFWSCGIQIIFILFLSAFVLCHIILIIRKKSGKYFHCEKNLETINYPWFRKVCLMFIVTVTGWPEGCAQSPPSYRWGKRGSEGQLACPLCHIIVLVPYGRCDKSLQIWWLQTEIYSHPVLEAGSQKSRCGQGGFHLGAQRGSQFQGSSSFWGLQALLG